MSSPHQKICPAQGLVQHMRISLSGQVTRIR
jgi:hypothetical protein